MNIYIPETLRYIDTVEQADNEYSLKEYFMPFLLYGTFVQRCSTFVLKTPDNTKKFVIHSDTKSRFYFDGCNKNNTSILIETNGYDQSTIFYFKYHKNNNTYFYLPTINAAITSCMLCPENNIVLYTGSFPNNNPTSHYLRITGMKGDDENIKYYLSWINFNIQIIKTISLGKNTYLGLSDLGQLIVFWQDENGFIRYAAQKHPQLAFCDIAVDNTIRTKSGFKHHIALLKDSYTASEEKRYELFVCDLLSFQKITLFLIQTISINNSSKSKINYITKLFYDKSRCGISYYENFSAKYTDF